MQLGNDNSEFYLEMIILNPFCQYTISYQPINISINQLNQPINQSPNFCSASFRISSIISRGLPGGCQGVARGFRGMSPTEPPGNPHRTLTEYPQNIKGEDTQRQSCSRCVPRFQKMKGKFKNTNILVCTFMRFGKYKRNAQRYFGCFEV